MRKLFRAIGAVLLLLVGCTSLPVESSESGIVQIASFDGYLIEGMLAMPDDGDADKLVIYVNGSGPNTYDNKRQIDEETQFTYFDLFRDEFTKRDIAFFSYNTRGVSIGDQPPLFASIDDEVYREYTPQNSVKDVVAMISYFRQQAGLENAKIILLGWSYFDSTFSSIRDACRSSYSLRFYVRRYDDYS